MKSLFLISIRLGKNTGGPAKQLGSPPSNRAVCHREIHDCGEAWAPRAKFASGRTWDRRLITGGYRDPISDVPADPQLETACLTEENALSGRKHDLFSVL